MRFYTNQHQYYCGIDLHTKNMYVCILDQAGKILVDKTLPTSPQKETAPELVKNLKILVFAKVLNLI